MEWSLYDKQGYRKYLTAAQRVDFIKEACGTDPETSFFCLTLALTGARISEVLMLTPDRVDVANSAIIFETMKRRQRGVFRSVPVPSRLLNLLLKYAANRKIKSDHRLWYFSRTTAWTRVKIIMRCASIPDDVAKPKALRHAFAVEAVQKRIALNLIKKWLGHAKIETTAIYADALGDEERNLARLTWPTLPLRNDP